MTKHKRTELRHALAGCKICAAVILERYERLEDVLRLRLEEMLHD